MTGEHDPLNPDGNQESSTQAGQEGSQAPGTDPSTSSEQAGGTVSSQEAAPEARPDSGDGDREPAPAQPEPGDAGGKGEGPPPPAPREAFPFGRLFLSILFALLAYFVFLGAMLLAFVQFVTIALAGEKNDELLQFSRRIAIYMKQIFDFMTLASDERPFPLGPFPKE